MEKLNVLILEDDRVIYQHLTKVLQKMGLINIFTAKNHREALELAVENRFHIMLSTVKIGNGFDGVDTVKTLQNLYNITVIFICNLNDEEILERVAEVSFIGYLVKPFREKELETLLIIAIKKYKISSFISPHTI